MSKVLALIPTGKIYWDTRVKSCMETWAKDREDVIFDPSLPDGYHELPHKVRQMFQQALANPAFDSYTHFCKADDDTIILMEKLQAYDFNGIDYCGWSNLNPDPSNSPWNYFSGGAGYVVSRRAAALIAAADIPDKEWAEDRWVGGIMHHAVGVSTRREPRFVPRLDFIVPDPITIHSVKTPQAMRELYERHLERPHD